MEQMLTLYICVQKSSSIISYMLLNIEHYTSTIEVTWNCLYKIDNPWHKMEAFIMSY